MRTGTRVSPSWPGLGPEAGYVEADRSRRTRRNHLQRGGPIGYPRASCLVRSRAPDACGKPLPVKIFSDRHVKSRAAPVAFKIVRKGSFVGPVPDQNTQATHVVFVARRPFAYADEAAPKSPSDLCFEPLPDLWVPANPRLTASARASIALRALPRSTTWPSAVATSQCHWPEPRCS